MLPATLTSLCLRSREDGEPELTWQLDDALALSQLSRLHTLAFEEVDAATLDALAALPAPLTALRDLKVVASGDLLRALPRLAPQLTALRVEAVCAWRDFGVVGGLARLRCLHFISYELPRSQSDASTALAAWTALSALTRLECSFSNFSSELLPALFADVLPALRALRVLRTW